MAHVYMLRLAPPRKQSLKPALTPLTRVEAIDRSWGLF